MKRHANGEGSFKKLPSGSWRVQIMVGYSDDGKKKTKSFTAPTKAEARQLLQAYLTQQHPHDETVTFSEWANAWYADYRTEVAASTYWNYGFTLKTLKDYFRDKPICEIKQIDINRFLDTLVERGLSKSTIGKCRSMLIQIFTSAQDNDLVVKNPVLRAKKVKAIRQVHKKASFTEEEIGRLRAFLPNDLLGNSILTLIGSGLRVQELLALREDDIASDGSWIRVNKAVKMAYRVPILGCTKSESGNRTIPIAKQYRTNVRYLHEHAGKRFVWTSERESGLYSIEEFRNRYKTVMSKVPSVPYYSPHCCRHTYITRLQAKGVPIDMIRILAGHQDSRTTLDYTHTSFETLQKLIASLDKEVS